MLFDVLRISIMFGVISAVRIAYYQIVGWYWNLSGAGEGVNKKNRVIVLVNAPHVTEKNHPTTMETP